MNYLDLFHGIGGFALGAYWASMKFENHFCSDIEPYTIELYKMRFPDSIQLGDITKIDFEKLKKDYPGEWIITGGFPCQDISIAGKDKGLIDEKGNKTRSGLWFDYWKGISILRPKFAIVENVRALLNRGLETVLGSLSIIGYNAEWQVISAADMGAPHKRERVWILAYSELCGCLYGQTEKQSTKAGEPSFSSIGTESKMADTNIKHDDRGGFSTSKISQFKKARIQKMSKQNCWSTEPAVGRLVDGLPGRVDRLKGLGNAIVPQIAELLFNRIKLF